MRRFMLAIAIPLLASGCQARALPPRPLGTDGRVEIGCGGGEPFRRVVLRNAGGTGACQIGAPPVPLGTGLYYLTVGKDGPRGAVNVTEARTGEPLGVELDLAGFEAKPWFNQPLGREGWTIGIAPGPSAGRSARYTLVLAASADAASDARDTDFCVHAASSAGRVECSMRWLRSGEYARPEPRPARPSIAASGGSQPAP